MNRARRKHSGREIIEGQSRITSREVRTEAAIVKKPAMEISRNPINPANMPAAGPSRRNSRLVADGLVPKIRP